MLQVKHGLKIFNNPPPHPPRPQHNQHNVMDKDNPTTLKMHNQIGSEE